MSDEQQCIFCHIASGKVPVKKVFEDDKLIAVLDINPAVPGHLLVIPKKHVVVLPQLDDDLIAHLGMVSKQLSGALIRALQVEGVSVFVANGAVAGQRAPHFLLHVIPRNKSDGVELQPAPVKIPESSLKQVFEKLAPVVAKHFGVEVAVEQKEPAKSSDEVKKPKDEVKKPEEAKKEPVKKSNLDDIADFLGGGK